MYVVQVASEVAPVAKVGGLGDVVYGLGKELVREGHRVEVVLPKYDIIHYEFLQGLVEVEDGIWAAKLEGMDICLVECGDYFERGKIYGCPDDVDRFLVFCSKAVEIVNKKKPDVIHLHDWPTATVAPLMKKELVHKAKTVLTLHNVHYQGKCSPVQLKNVGLEGEAFEDPLDPMLGNILKGGIVYADAITTVSPNYEHEIKTKEGGFGLEDTLVKYEKKLKGILNGIDLEFWNPETDSHLIAHYSAQDSIEDILRAKKKNKSRLLKHLGMEERDGPLIASVTRLVQQKGPDLIKYALMRTLEMGGQFVLLGSSAEPEVDKMFRDLKNALASNKNVSISLNKDDALAHQIFASSDAFIIPSIFEPCGLTQLIALRYGTVPIARMTGGLVDTVFDMDTSPRNEEERNGFTFEFPDAEGVNWALNRAIDHWKNDQAKWQRIIKQGMNQDYSWSRSVHEYLEVYKTKGFFRRLKESLF